MTDKKREVVLPCPFCGRDARYAHSGLTFEMTKASVTCLCGGNCGWHDDMEEAIKAWNTRTNTANAEARELVGELMEFILSKWWSISDIETDEVLKLRNKTKKWLEDNI